MKRYNDQSKKSVDEYYKSVATDYKLFWNLKKIRAMRIGLWNNQTRNLAEALSREDEMVAQKAAIKRTDLVLDIGCGYGATAIHIAKKYRCRVVGINLSPTQVKIARKNAEKENVSRLVCFLEMDFHNLAFPADSFDVVIAIESLSHTSNKKKAVKEAHRVLKKEGRIVGMDYFSGDENYLPNTESMREKIMQGLCFEEFPYTAKFHQWVRHTGFQLVHLIDLTEQVLPSARRLYILSSIGLTLERLLEWMGLRKPYHGQLALATNYQYRALRQGVHQYCLFYGEKKCY